jgi:6-phosphogluconolactonase
VKNLVRIAALLGVFVLGALAAAGTRPAAAKSDVAGHVYVNNNTVGVNTISALNRAADGALTPIQGSPFAIGGSGIGAPVGSQGALQISADGRYLLAVDAGSNEISILKIKSNGSLRPVEGGPFSSGGLKPVSIAVHHDVVYVANAGSGGSNYTGFTLNADGHLRPIANSTFSLPDNANPGDILFSSEAQHDQDGQRHLEENGHDDGTYFVGMRVGPNAGPSFIDSFIVGSDGRLTPAAGSPFVPQGVGPFGSVFSPTHSGQLFVTIAHAGAGNGEVSAYTDSNGILMPVALSPFTNGQSGTCWAEISHDGKYLFVVNTGSTTISRYSVATGGSLTLLGNTPMTNPGPGGLGAFDARLSPQGDYLYVVDASGRVSAFSVSGGNLTELPFSPVQLSAGATPFGIVVD